MRSRLLAPLKRQPAAAKVSAALDGRDYVLPDDIDELVIPVLAHRVLLTRRSLADNRAGGLGSSSGGSRAVDEVLRRIVAATAVPLVAARKG